MSLKERALRTAEQVLDQDVYYKYVLGIRKEYSGLNPIAATLLIARSRLHATIHKSRIEGYAFPEDGPAIVTGHHIEEADNLKICIAAVNSGRLIRAVIKKGLVVEGFSESAEYLKSIEAEDDSLDYRPLTAYVLKGEGAIAIDREKPTLSFLRETDAVLDAGEMLGIYIQGHRYKDGLLKHLQVGAAVIARRHPDVPIYPCAFNGYPYGEDRLTIVEPFTYNQKLRQLGREISVEEFTIIIADTINSARPYVFRQDWKTRRAEEFAKLTKSTK